MKKRIIITVVVLFAVIGGLAAKVAVDRSKDKKADQGTVITEAPGESPLATKEPETAEPTTGVEATTAPTDEATATPTAEVTEAPTEEEATKAPETDYSSYSDSDLMKEIVKTITSRHASVSKMTEKERTVYSVYVYNNQIKKGLHAYLTGSENVSAAYLSKGFAAIYAKKSKELFDDFVDTFHIDLSDTKALSKMKESEYHFDIFDDEYANIAKEENLTALLAKYIKNNLDDLK